MPDYSNATVDTAAAAVAAPYGPLTRVTDVEALPSPNSGHKFEFTDAAANTIFARYDEIVDAERVVELLAEANGLSAVVHGVLTELDAIVTAVPIAVDGQYSYAEYQTVIQRVQAIAATRNNL